MNFLQSVAIVCVITITNFQAVYSLWCYRCVSSHPGCGLFDFDWRYYWSYYCDALNDKCVKIIEQRGADVMVIRDCLSSLETFRRDIPADHYEGCRPAAKDPLLAHYVNSSILESDVKRDYYRDTLYCFCEFDERCNGSLSLDAGLAPVFLLTSAVIFSRLVSFF